MALIVKAYFTEGNDPEVIKRFNIDADVTTSYEYLRRKIVQAFPNLNARNFTTYWRDGENDQIIFSSDEELMQALSQVDNGVLKIYIKIYPRTSHSKFQTSEQRECPFMKPSCSHPGFTSKPQNAGPHNGFPFIQPPMTGGRPGFPFMPLNMSGVHIGVTCDGCEGEVRGVRFKCTQCHDYDLCVVCKKKGMHNEHEFREIACPVNMFQEMFKQFNSQFAANGKVESNSQNDSTSKNVNSDSDVKFEDHIENVGKFVESFLQPFGINFNIDVYASPKAQADQDKEMPCSNMKCSEATSCNRKMQGCDADKKSPCSSNPKCNRKACDKTSTEKCCDRSTQKNGNDDVEMVDAEQIMKNKCCAKAQADQNKEMPGSNMTCFEATSCNRKIQGCSADKKSPFSSNSKCNRKACDRTQNNGNDDAEMVDAEQIMKNKCCAFTDKKSACRLNANKPLLVNDKASKSDEPMNNEWVDVEETIFPGDELMLNEDKGIRDSLAKLKAMGYNDEGGWLTALLTATEGDVNKALDLIHAKP